MTRHPATEGNDLKPASIKTQPGGDVVVVDENGGETSLKNFQESARKEAIKFAVAL